jgi:DNA-binding LytR/AlgR family response regulator
VKKADRLALNPIPMKLKTIVVDDDEAIRKIMRHFILRTPFLEFQGEYSSALAASEFMMKNQTDIVLLDVLMPDMTGMDFLKAFKNDRLQVILISSDTKYAFEAFETNVTDYILKPVTYDRFLKAILKAKKVYDASNAAQENANNEVENIFAKVNGRYVKIDIHDILIVEALADYVSIYTSSQRYIVHSTMKGIQSKLPSKDFCRIHNSYIVRLDKVTEIEDNTLTINKKVIPISRSHYKELKEHLKLL